MLLPFYRATSCASSSSSSSSDVLDDSTSSDDDIYSFLFKSVEEFFHDNSHEKLQERICVENYDKTILAYSDRNFLTHFRVSRDIVNNLIVKYGDSKFCQLSNFCLF